ncbi:MAG: hypothetical protein MI725_01130, partial [Pirellulales bacterium]|nr:hypothetical protein [Pirellulales bacterium]
SLLGVTANSAPLATNSTNEFFVRGNDLVTNFAQTNEQPFSCQIYWRATLQSSDVILLDTIISVQTELLESFPQIAVETQLESDEAWLVSDTQTAKQLTGPADGNEPGCILLRAAEAGWSYAEMAHPDDGETWQIDKNATSNFALHRQLGGAFLEKGVIRRMRVRGAFLPRENDLELAAGCFASLVAELPPLTA